MIRDRLELALERLGPGDWEPFEQLAQAFVASVNPNLVTLASPGGDGGRDGILWRSDGDPTVAVQYSVTRSWAKKILDTCFTLRKNHGEINILIFHSPHVIGPASDEVITKARVEHGMHVQVRDRSWFLDRVGGSPAIDAAAERLAERYVDPLLRERSISMGYASPLTTTEGHAAVLYLQLQLEDDNAEKGLTKSCFEALVRAALRETDPDNRMTRADVHERIREVVPGGTTDEVAIQINSALRRLEKVHLRFYRDDDTFCLTYDERRRLEEHQLRLATVDGAIKSELEVIVRRIAEGLSIELPDDLSDLLELTFGLLHRVLLERAEDFAASMTKGSTNVMTLDEVQESAVRSVAEADGVTVKSSLVPVMTAAVHGLLEGPSRDALLYMQTLSASFTLFTLVQSTPNVQKALVKMFSGGEIWLDASAALPLFAETLADAERQKYTRLVEAAREAGVRFYVTDGVIEELERHMNRALAYASSDRWRGTVPYLYTAYVLSGSPRSQFGKWIETFRGRSRPLDDVAEYLRHELGVRVRNLTAEVASASDDYRIAVKEEWLQIQDSRRARTYMDAATMNRLADHDTENYVGVVQRRRSVEESPLGYGSWWLTLDQSARSIDRRVRDRLGRPTPMAPVMSPDFLLQYLAIGPIRSRLDKKTLVGLPLMIDAGQLDVLPRGIVELAERISADLDSLPPRVIERRIRDAMDIERARRGELAQTGLKNVHELFEQTDAADS